ncbi:hypothetical protein NDU88_006398 [Pleurodeles waltl]|uniref:Uncharacterized protein n=1 Tax=Pleurodeles waltl TaxID=8319 RepID=A0AAV7UNV7_PLEWA|nr:hypothetical protein NDU88_006398 [Pleurodeles waltl]
MCQTHFRTYEERNVVGMRSATLLTACLGLPWVVADGTLEPRTSSLTEDRESDKYPANPGCAVTPRRQKWCKYFPDVCILQHEFNFTTTQPGVQPLISLASTVFLRIRPPLPF